MRQEYMIREFTVICNVTGKVEQVISYNSSEVLPEVGQNFSKLLDKDSQTVFRNFLYTVKNQGYALGYVLTIKIDNVMQPVCVNAYYKNHKIYISVLIGCQATIRTLSEIHRLNQKQMDYIKTEEIKDQELNEYVDMLENWVMKDPLTNIHNHRYFSSVIYKEAEKAHQSGYCLNLISIDFDHLKEYNDEFGYRKGDELLVNFVTIAQGIIRDQKDIIFRLGGDEFLILCPDTNPVEAYRLMEEIENVLKNYTTYSSISYGVVEIKPEALDESFDINLYLEEADRIIKQDKKNKNPYKLKYKI